jgi:hypothetical protein
MFHSFFQTRKSHFSADFQGQTLCRNGVHYNQEQYVSLFFQTQKSHFSADFQGQEGVHIMQECALYNPNDGNNTAKHRFRPQNMVEHYKFCRP